MGVLLDNTSEYRYVRNAANSNTPASYTDTANNSCVIYTTYFNRDLYLASRDTLLAHEGLGHAAGLPHTFFPHPNPYSIMYSHDGPNRTGFGHNSSNGHLVKVNDVNDDRIYISPPSTFSDTHPDHELQLRE